MKLMTALSLLAAAAAAAAGAAPPLLELKVHSKERLSSGLATTAQDTFTDRPNTAPYTNGAEGEQNGRSEEDKRIVAHVFAHTHNMTLNK